MILKVFAATSRGEREINTRIMTNNLMKMEARIKPKKVKK